MIVFYRVQTVWYMEYAILFVLGFDPIVGSSEGRCEPW